MGTKEEASANMRFPIAHFTTNVDRARCSAAQTTQ